MVTGFAYRKLRPWASPVLALFTFLYTPLVYSQSGPSNINISGALFDSAGAAITSPSVNFKIELYDKSGTCLIYTEDHLAVDLSQTKGAFSVDIGSGSSIQNLIDSGSPTAMSSKVYENVGVIAGGWTGCSSGATLADGDSRVIRIKYNLGGGYVTMNPDVPLAAAAYATVAQTLQGKRPADFIQVHNDVSNKVTQANVENVFSSTNYPKLTALLAGSSADYISVSPSAAVGFNNQRITNLADPSGAQDAATKNYADSNLGGKSVDVSGVGPATGDGYTLIWDQATQKWTTGSPSATDNTKLPLAGGTMTGAIDMGGYNILAAGHITMSPLKTLTLGTFTSAQETTLVGTLTAANAGASWYNTTTNTFKIWDGSAAISQSLSGAAAGGDLTGTYPNPTIANDKITSAKVDSAGIGINRLVISDQTTGGSLKFATCATNEVLRYEGVNGWICHDPTAIVTFPVTKVNGKTGDITLNANDLGLGTAALENVGTAAGEIPVLDAGGKIPASMIPAASSPTWGDITNGAGKYMTYKPNNTACATNEILKFDGTNWICSDISTLGTGDFMKDGSVAMTGNFNAGGNSILGNTTASANLTLESTSNATKGKVLIQPNGGNVGINTTNPLWALDVNGGVHSSARFTGVGLTGVATSAFAPLVTQNTGAGTDEKYWDIYHTATALSIRAVDDSYASSNTAMQFNRSGYTISSTVFPSGNVGIGTATPARLLHVNGPMRITPAALPGTPAAGDLAFDSGAANALKFYDGSAWQTVGTGTGSGDFKKDGSVAMTGNFNAGGNSVLGNTTASANLTLESTSDATKGSVVIQPNGGNVGIGTSTPGQPLSVYKGTDYVALNPGSNSVFTIVNNTTESQVMIRGGGSLANFADIALKSIEATPKTWQLSHKGPGSGGVLNAFGFEYNNGSSWLNPLTILPTGEVGIGTTAPARQLHVSGPIRIKPAALPSSPAAGDLAFDSGASNALKFYNGSAWQTVGTGSGSGDFMKDGSVAMTGNFNAGGNSILGNTTASANLTLESTSDATKGNLLLQPNGGFVGIGTATPTAALHIFGTTGAGATFRLTRNESGGRGGSFNFETARGPFGVAGSQTLLNHGLGQINFRGTDETGTLSDVDQAAIIAFAAEDTTTTARGALLSFRTTSIGSTSAASERMRLTANGYLGIGTTAPGSILDINGAQTFRGMAAPSVAGSGNGRIYFDSTSNKFMVSQNGTAYAALATTGGSGGGQTSTTSLTFNSDSDNSGSDGGYSFQAHGSPLLTVANNGDTAVTSTTAASNSSTAALTVAGGIGVGNNIIAAGSISGNGVTSNGSDTTVYTSTSVTVGYPNGPFLRGWNSSNTNGSATSLLLSPKNSSNIQQNAFISAYSISGASAYTPVIVFGQQTGANAYSERMRIDTAGNVGIGTTTPGRLLDVGGPIRIKPAALPSSPAAGDLAFDSGAANALKYYDGSAWQTIGTGTGSGDFMKDGSVAMTGNFNAGGNSVLGNTTASANLTLESTSNATKGKVLIQPNGGNVGIGTSTTPAKLTVVGSGSGASIEAARFSGDVGTPWQVAATIANTNATNQGTALNFDSNAGTIWSLGHDLNSTGTDDFFISHNANAGATALYIDANEKVGIGTTTPTRRLDVAGSIHIQPTALPSSPTAGELAFDSGAANALKFYDGSAWQTVGTGGGSGDFKKDGSVAMTGNFNAGGNKILGNTTASANLILESTSNATKGDVTLQPTGGSVGIGTTSAAGGNTEQTFLQVGDSTGALITGGAFVSGQDNLALFGQNMAYSSFGADMKTVYNGAYSGIGANTGVLSFYTSSSGTNWTSISPTPRMTILANGNVGIGTTTAGYTLDINTSATTRGVNIRDSGVAAKALYVTASATTGAGTGIYSTIASTNDSAYAVAAYNTAASGQGSAIYGSSVSSNGYSSAILGQATAGQGVAGISSSGVGIYGQSSTGVSALFITSNSGNTSPTLVTQQAGASTANLFEARNSSNTALSVITSTGAVGAGTTSPARLLHVGGPMRITPAALPSAPAAGDLAFDSAASNALKFYDGSSWQTVGTGTGSGDFKKDGSVAMTGNFNAGGNSILGNTTASANLTLESTSNATKGYVLLQPNGGNVGIGTATPTSALDVRGVSGDVTSLGVMRFNSNNGTNDVGMKMGAIAGAGSIGYSFIQSMHTGVGNDANLILNPSGSGNVGIGTTSPGYPLDVNGNMRASGYFVNANTVGLHWGANESVTGHAGSHYVAVTTNGSERIRVDSSGNVGVGTNSPARTLHVNGAARLTPTTTPATPAAGDFFFDSGASNALKYYNGSAWQTVGTGTGDFMKDGSVAMTGAFNAGNQDLNNVGNITGSGATMVVQQGSGNNLILGNASGASTLTMQAGSGAMSINGGGSVQLTSSKVGAAAVQVAATGGTTSTALISSNGTSAGAVTLKATGTNGGITLTPNGTGVVTSSTPILITPAALPASPAAGYLAFDSAASNALKFYDGSAWQVVGTSTSQWTTSGSNIYYNTGGAVSIGTTSVTGNGEMLRVRSPNAYNTMQIETSNAAGASELSFANTSGVGTFFVGYDQLGDTYSPGNAYLNMAVANNLVFNFNATETMRITSAGNVGIGTTSPARRLHVNGAARLTPTTTPATPAAGDFFFDSAASNALKFYDGSAWQTVGTGSGSGDFKKDGSVAMTGNFNAGGNSILGNTTASANLTLESTSNATKGYVNLQPNGGNVGIGTTTPGYKLDVRDNQSNPSGIYVRNSSANNNAYPGLFIANDVSAAYAGNVHVGSSATSSTHASRMVVEGLTNGVSVMASGASGTIQMYTGGETSAEERMRITSTGNVGIGTSTPAAILDVQGGTATSANGKGINLVAQNANGTNKNGGDINLTPGLGSGGGNTGNVYINNFADLKISSGSKVDWGTPYITGHYLTNYLELSGSGSADMRIDASGNVGIGTTSPARRLHVNGAARLTPTTTPATPAAGDFFFDSAASNALKFYNGSAWQTVATGSGSGDFMKDGSVAMTGNFNAGGNKILGNTTASANLILESTSNATKGNIALQPSGGNVAIGTTAGSDNFEVYNTANGSAGITLSTPGTGSAQNSAFTLMTRAASGSDYLGTSTSKGWIINARSNAYGTSTDRNKMIWGYWNGTSWINPFAVDTSGNVGIGTTAPTSLLTLAQSDATPRLEITTLNSTSGGQWPGIDINNFSGSFTANPQIQMSNSRGTSSVTAPLQTDDALGYLIFAGANNTTQGFVQSAAIAAAAEQDFGTSAAGTYLVFKTTSNNSTSISERMRITAGGNVGIGTDSPRTPLEVNGAVISAPAVSNSAPATTAVNFLTGNVQYTSATCASGWKLNNLKDGGTYTLIVKSTTSGTCTFSAFSGVATGALTVHMPPDHGATTSGKHTLYTFLVAGSDLYVSWVPGY